MPRPRKGGGNAVRLITKEVAFNQLTRWMEEAEYETGRDSYRGMRELIDHLDSRSNERNDGAGETEKETTAEEMATEMSKSSEKDAPGHHETGSDPPVPKATPGGTAQEPDGADTKDACSHERVSPILAANGLIPAEEEPIAPNVVDKSQDEVVSSSKIITTSTNKDDSKRSCTRTCDETETDSPPPNPTPNGTVQATDVTDAKDASPNDKISPRPVANGLGPTEEEPIAPNEAHKSQHQEEPSATVETTSTNANDSKTLCIKTCDETGTDPTPPKSTPNGTVQAADGTDTKDATPHENGSRRPEANSQVPTEEELIAPIEAIKSQREDVSCREVEATSGNTNDSKTSCMETCESGSRDFDAIIEQFPETLGPWFSCCAIKDGRIWDGGTSISPCPSCPSVKRWIAEGQTKGRPFSTARSPCDSNPFCLASTYTDNLNVNDDWSDPQNPQYCLQTQAMYSKTRKSELVNVGALNEYWDDVLQGLKDASSPLDWIRRHHSGMVFLNPLLDGRDQSDSEDSIRISSPPGMENLGATCYLNTQLQCLAQNLVFVNGILRWQRSSDDRMSNVLALFQSLLLRMRAGPNATVDTTEFSNALGLDHHEQQDPNEFSGLLLQKMHESFAGNDSLRDLIPIQFEGKCSWTTVCQECGGKSGPTETFMDLKIPIAVPPPSPKKEKQPSLFSCYLSKVSKSTKKKAPPGVTDLDYCFMQYCQEEKLEGDNQYFCSQCQAKRNAVRRLVFTKLPSVLNLQLVRYVWQQTVKCKVSTAVRLPDILKVGDKNYRLSAIMSHQGTSAYSGHYVGEAMDWMTGQWYSFNDEHVSLLSKGPASLYSTREGKKTACKGSSDAYNLYYVEESFLAQSLLEGSGIQNDSPLVQNMASRRVEHYTKLAQLCSVDGKAAERLRGRRLMIENNIRPLQPRSLNDWRDSVWVSTDVWLRFMTGTDRLDDVLELTPLLQHRHLLCPHGKLHPRTARRGKLLPRPMYDAYVEALNNESTYIYGVARESTDILITPHNGKLFCDTCCEEYSKSIQRTLDVVDKIQTLYENLGDKKILLDKTEPSLEETWGNECDRHVFVIERKFISTFRNTFENSLRKLVTDAMSASSSGGESVEGIDGFITDQFLLKKDEKISNFQSVNPNISCKHGKLMTNNKQRFKYVRFATWRLLRDLFPLAVEIKITRKWEVPPSMVDAEMKEKTQRSILEDVGRHDEAEEFFGCAICKDERESHDDLDFSDSEIGSSAPGKEATQPRNEKAVITLIESDNDSVGITKTKAESTFPLRVYEISDATDEEEIRKSLVACLAGGNQSPGENSEELSYVRRSSRRKRVKYPVGVISAGDSIQANLDRNVASLRLLLVERCLDGFELHHELRLAISVQRKTDFFGLPDLSQSTPFQLIDLPFDSNGKSLRSVCEEAAGQEFGLSFDPSESVVLLRHSSDENSLNLPREELWDHLITVANVDSAETNTCGKGSRKRQRTERGFRGTFLAAESQEGQSDETARSSTPVEDSVKPKVAPSKETGVSSPKRKQPFEPDVSSVKKPRIESSPDLVDTSGTPSSESSESMAMKTDNKYPDTTVAIDTSGAATESSEGMVLNAHNKSPATRVTKIPNKSPEEVDANFYLENVAVETLAKGLQPDSDDEDEEDLYLQSIATIGLHQSKCSKSAILCLLMTNPDIQPVNSEMASMAVDEALKSNGDGRDSDALLSTAYGYYLNLTHG